MPTILGEISVRGEQTDRVGELARPSVHSTLTLSRPARAGVETVGAKSTTSSFASIVGFTRITSPSCLSSSTCHLADTRRCSGYRAWCRLSAVQLFVDRLPHLLPTNPEVPHGR